MLQNALQNIPNPTSECMLRNVAIRLAQQISDEVSMLFLAKHTFCVIKFISLQLLDVLTYKKLIFVYV